MDDDVHIEMLMFGAQKLLRIFYCTLNLAWDES